MMKNPNFHHFSDGKGNRNIFINGNQVRHVIWADVEKGVLEYAPQPLRIHKRKRDEVYTRKLRGVITVAFVGGDG